MARGQGLNDTNMRTNMNLERVDDYESEAAQFNDRASNRGGSRPASGHDPEASVQQNLLKILFTDLTETPQVVNALQQKNLSLLHRYWEQTAEESNFSDFEARYCTEKGLMSTPEAKAVYTRLRDDFHEVVQEALDRIYNACCGLPSKQSKELFAHLKNMKVDELGMVSITDAAGVFAKIHLTDRVLYEKMNEVY